MTVIECLKLLLFSDVLDNTYGCMIALRNGLDSIVTCDSELLELLLQLHSESIREALHKSELSITNGVIRSKNRILKASGIEVPESHGIIDVDLYKGYNW